jgi:ankyrin repeat protein
MWIVRFRHPENYQEMQALLASFGGRMPLHNEFEDPSYEELLAGDQETLEMLNSSGELLSGIIHNDDVGLLDRYVELMGNDHIKLVAPNRGAYIPPSLAMLDRLVEHGMNINQRDWRGTTMLFAGESVEWLARCLHHGANLDVVEFVDCSTRLAYDAKENNLDMVRFLLDNGADPNLPTEHAWARPLAQAENNGHTKMKELLVEAGAHPG